KHCCAPAGLTTKSVSNCCALSTSVRRTASKRKHGAVCTGLCRSRCLRLAVRVLLCPELRRRVPPQFPGFPFPNYSYFASQTSIDEKNQLRCARPPAYCRDCGLSVGHDIFLQPPVLRKQDPAT